MKTSFNRHQSQNKSEKPNIKQNMVIVCPFSQLENQISEAAPINTFFLTRMGARIDDMDLDTQEAVRDFISAQKISCITMVVSPDCMFIDRIISRKKRFGMGPETILENIYIEHFNEKFRYLDIASQKAELAKLYAKDQLESLANLTLLKNVLKEKNIELYFEVVTESKVTNKRITLDIQNIEA
jgi:hypothetical protein